MIKVIVMVLALMGGGVALMGQPGVCRSGFCPDIDCPSSSACGPGCMCLKQGMDQLGECYSTNAFPQLVEQGYRVLP